MLTEISKQEFVNIYDDEAGYITQMDLQDYDWMTYTFTAQLPIAIQTEEKPVTNRVIHFSIEHIGIVCDNVKIKIVDWTTKKTTDECKFTIPAKMFEEFRKTYLTAHLAAIGDKCAFCGDKLAVSFYNTIINFIHAESMEQNREKNTEHGN